MAPRRSAATSVKLGGVLGGARRVTTRAPRAMAVKMEPGVAEPTAALGGLSVPTPLRSAVVCKLLLSLFHFDLGWQYPVRRNVARSAPKLNLLCVVYI